MNEPIDHLAGGENKPESSVTVKNTGGPAFPWGEFGSHLGGMDLRDYLAAKALVGLIGGRSWDHLEEDEIVKQWATASYAVADEMLKARDA